jgi:lipopolysaccharide transport system permease protein
MAVARTGMLDIGYYRELVLHLAGREITSQHRLTLLGWTWPLARLLAQLAVIVFVFSKLFDLGIDNYTVFVFSGLLAFTWFSTGVSEAATSLLSQRHFVFQPRFPTAVVPLVAVTVPLVDVLLALPVLLVMLVATGDLGFSALLLPPLLVIQLVLMCGLAWLCAATTVYLRDVPNVVLVGLTLLFYMTPVFYSVDRIPEKYRWVLELNPLTTLVEAYRAVLLGQSAPGAIRLLVVSVVSVVVAILGLLLFRWLQPGFVDEL